MRLQFSLLTFLLAVTVLATVLWNYAPRSNQVIIEKTGRMLDLAIVGEGYFELTSHEGKCVFTREGRFEINPDGRLIHEGTTFDVASGIQVPPDFTRIEVTPAGQMLVRQHGTDNLNAIGQLNLNCFAKPNKLLPLGKGCVQNTDGSGQALSFIPGELGAGYIVQGWHEMESSTWSLQDNLPILMLLICVGAASIQVWVAIRPRSKC